MVKKTEKKQKEPKLSIDQRAARYAAEMESEFGQDPEPAQAINNNQPEPKAPAEPEQKQLPAPALAQESAPAAPAAAQAPAAPAAAQAPAAPADMSLEQRFEMRQKEVSMQMKLQKEVDRQKNTPADMFLFGAPDDRVCEVARITGDEAFIYAVMDMQDAIFDPNRTVSLRHILSRGYMHNTIGINGDGRTDGITLAQFKEEAKAAENGLNIFAKRPGS